MERWHSKDVAAGTAPDRRSCRDGTTGTDPRAEIPYVKYSAVREETSSTERMETQRADQLQRVGTGDTERHIGTERDNETGTERGNRVDLQ